MRRFSVLLIVMCMLLTALPAMAGVECLGDMEVVNCNDWVSMREVPSTRAKQLVKVSLGAIVSNCQQFSDEWIYAEYDGYGGYILAKYLQPSDGRLTFNAMMITITGEGAPFYATIDGEEPIDFIPANTIVRNCCIMENGRIYVEWGSRCGFIRLEHAEVYSEMLHFPQQITLYCNLFDGEYEGPAPALKADYAEGFLLKEYDCSKYEQDDAGSPRAEFVLHSDTTISNVHLFSVSLRSMDDETGEAVVDATLEHIQYQVDPAHPLSVSAVIYGMMPNLAVGYQDATGFYHFAFVEISGEDGSLVLNEF